jgi:selenocysteine-specific elongation factor
VTGTLVAGTIHEDSELVVLPRERIVKVRGLQVHGQRQRAADPGHRVAVNLGGVEVGDLSRGDTLCAPGAFEPTQRIDAVMELVAGSRPLRHGSRVRFHQGTTELLGRVAVGAEC